MRQISVAVSQRFRMLCSVLRQGFDLCEARERPMEVATTVMERQLEPLLPVSSAPVRRCSGSPTRFNASRATI